MKRFRSTNLTAAEMSEIDQIPKEVYALALSKVILAKAQDYIIAHTAKSLIRVVKDIL